MPKIKIIVVGNTKASFLKEGESLYLKRLKQYTPVEWIEVKPEKITKKALKEKLLALEGVPLRKNSTQEITLLSLMYQGRSILQKPSQTESNSYRGRATLCVL
jgi:23S rRNA pseudoU1915 N3-methylase RlmH